jgi:hypothetical protein
MDLVHYGNPQSGFQRGFSDLVASQGAKMLTLLSYAMTVHSAYVAVNTERSNLLEVYDTI